MSGAAVDGSESNRPLCLDSVRRWQPTAVWLMAASRTLQELTDTFTQQIEQLAERGDQMSLTEFFRLIASSAAAHERYRLCWVEAMVAARTDNALADVMRPLDQAKTERWRDIATRLETAEPDLAVRT